MKHTSQHMVTLCNRTRKVKGFGLGGRRKLWAFSYNDLAYLYNVEVQTIKNLVCQGKIDPCDLSSVVKYYLDHRVNNIAHIALPEQEKIGI